MKTLFTLLLTLALVGCASAMPPMPPPTRTNFISFSWPDDARVKTVIVVKANDSSTNWLVHGTYTGTIGQDVVFVSDNNYRLYAAACADDLGRGECGNVATNDSLKPVTLKLGK